MTERKPLDDMTKSNVTGWKGCCSKSLLDDTLFNECVGGCFCLITRGIQDKFTIIKIDKQKNRRSSNINSWS